MTKFKKNLTLACIVFFCSAAKAQSGPVSAGGDATGAGGSVSYSIGQIDHITAEGTGGTITQGLQQPYEIYIITGVEVVGIELTATVYPNPTADQVTLKVSSLLSSGMSYRLTDAQGKLIREADLSASETVVNMTELSKAAYFITVMNKKKEVKTFKIIKN